MIEQTAEEVAEAMKEDPLVWAAIYLTALESLEETVRQLDKLYALVAKQNTELDS